MLFSNARTLMHSIRRYGNIKDSERIFQNIYKDESEWLDGALKRVSQII